MLIWEAFEGDYVPERMLEALYRNIGKAVLREAMASAMQADDEVPVSRIDSLYSNAKYYRGCADTLILDIAEIVDDNT
jgi:hypothetical protein